MFFFVFRYEYTTNICHLQVFGCLFSFFHVFSVVSGVYSSYAASVLPRYGNMITAAWICRYSIAVMVLPRGCNAAAAKHKDGNSCSLELLLPSPACPSRRGFGLACLCLNDYF
jgi:hypothetical protein